MDGHGSALGRANRTRLTIGSVLTFYAAAIGRSIEASVFGVQELEASDE